MDEAELQKRVDAAVAQLRADMELAAADAARPLLAKIAGLEQQARVLRGQRTAFAVAAVVVAAITVGLGFAASRAEHPLLDLITR